MPKLTFSLDDETVETLRRTAERTRKPQSLVVREAIAQYAAQEDTTSLSERERLLTVVRQLRTKRSTRSAADVDRELREVRQSRRTGWSRPTK